MLAGSYGADTMRGYEGYSKHQSKEVPDTQHVSIPCAWCGYDMSVPGDMPAHIKARATCCINCKLELIQHYEGYYSDQ